MKPGMIFTIEPAIIDTPADSAVEELEIDIWEDGWTLASTKLHRSCQFEHTILITNTGHEILTLQT